MFEGKKTTAIPRGGHGNMLLLSSGLRGIGRAGCIGWWSWHGGFFQLFSGGIWFARCDVMEKRRQEKSRT